MKQKLLVLVNANWPTLPAKVNDLKASFFPEIELSIDARETHFATFPFKDYGEQKRIDEIGLTLTSFLLAENTMSSLYPAKEPMAQ